MSLCGLFSLEKCTLKQFCRHHDDIVLISEFPKRIQGGPETFIGVPKLIITARG